MEKGECVWKKASVFGKDESDDMRLIGNQLIKCATAVVAHVVSFPDLSPPQGDKRAGTY